MDSAGRGAIMAGAEGIVKSRFLCAPFLLRPVSFAPVLTMEHYVLSIDQCHGRTPFPGVAMFVTEAEKMTLSIVEMAPHSVSPEHSHPHEQIGYMVEGEFEFQIGGKSYQVGPGQIWRIPGGVPHKVIAGPHKVRAVDVFYPVRDDMRPPK